MLIGYLLGTAFMAVWMLLGISHSFTHKMPEAWIAWLMCKENLVNYDIYLDVAWHM